MKLMDKLFNEHRIAWGEIVSIDKSKSDIADKINRIIKLFDSELLPHFKQEEDEIFIDDAMSKELMAEHQKIYDIMDEMKSNRAGEDMVKEFIDIMKNHIKKEDSYFNNLENTEKREKRNWIILGIIILAIIIFLIVLTTKTISK